MNLWNGMVFPQAVFQIIPDSQTPSTDGAFGAENFDSRLNPDVADVLKQLSLSEDSKVDHSYMNLTLPGDPDDDDIYLANDDNPAESSDSMMPMETAAVSMCSAHTTSPMATLPPNDIVAISHPPMAIVLDSESSDPTAPKKATRTRSSAQNTTQATVANTEV